MSGVASEMEERKGKEDSAMKARRWSAEERSENFTPRRISSLFRAEAIPGFPVHGAGSRVKGREEGIRLTSERRIPTLLAAALLLIANRGFFKRGET